jgi:N-acetylglucosaminyldiphosphoundecaprenol N-acetyl-beta-D-mannosaminyltransferase
MVTCATGREGALGAPPATVLYANVHVLNVAYGDPELHRRLRAATTVYCDGSGVRLGARLAGARLPPRLTAADWIDDLCARCAEDEVGLFLLGGEEGVAEKAASVLVDRHPRLPVPGSHHGFLNEAASRRVVEQVNRSGTRILVVGMGTPIQEAWIDRWRGEIEAPVVWAVGALLDFVAGVQPRAPLWMGDWHLEWLWRLGTNPVRLGRRYLVGNPVFMWRIVVRASSMNRNPTC